MFGIIQRHSKGFFPLRRNLKHGVHHDGLDNGTQTASTKFVLHSLVHNIFEHGIFEFQLHTVHLKEFDILFDDGVFGFRQDGTQSSTIQRIQISEHRQTTDNFRNQAKGLQILRSNILHQIILINGSRIAYSTIAYNMGIQTLGNFLLDTIKRSATNEENILGINRYHLLFRMFSSALGRYIDYRTFEQLQQPLLYAFTTDITSNRRIVSLTGNLINFIYKHNTTLSFSYIIISHLKQTGQNAFNILTYIASFGQYRSIYNRERHMQQLGNGTCQQCFTCTRTAHHDDV